MQNSDVKDTDQLDWNKFFDLKNEDFFLEEKNQDDLDKIKLKPDWQTSLANDLGLTTQQISNLPFWDNFFLAAYVFNIIKHAPDTVSRPELLDILLELRTHEKMVAHFNFGMPILMINEAKCLENANSANFVLSLLHNSSQENWQQIFERVKDQDNVAKIHAVLGLGFDPQLVSSAKCFEQENEEEIQEIFEFFQDFSIDKQKEIFQKCKDLDNVAKFYAVVNLELEANDVQDAKSLSNWRYGKNYVAFLNKLPKEEAQELFFKSKHIDNLAKFEAITLANLDPSDVSEASILDHPQGLYIIDQLNKYPLTERNGIFKEIRDIDNSYKIQAISMGLDPVKVKNASCFDGKIADIVMNMLHSKHDLVTKQQLFDTLQYLSDKTTSSGNDLLLAQKHNHFEWILPDLLKLDNVQEKEKLVNNTREFTSLEQYQAFIQSISNKESDGSVNFTGNLSIETDF